MNVAEMGEMRNGACLGTDFIGIRGIIARDSVVNGRCGIVSAERGGAMRCQVGDGAYAIAHSTERPAEQATMPVPSFA